MNHKLDIHCPALQPTKGRGITESSSTPSSSAKAVEGHRAEDEGLTSCCVCCVSCVFDYSYIVAGAALLEPAHLVPL